MIAHTTSSCLSQVLWPRGAVARQASLAPGFQVPSDLACLIGRFAPISLAQMDGVALQDRTDTKYVFHARLLRPALAALAEQYRILEIEDVRLRFRSEQRTVALPGVVIAEVKQARYAHTSDFMRLMRAHHLRSVGFSKYCIGVSLLYPDVKHNSFKAQHRLLARLMEGANHDCY